jgi:type I restriction enzyme S subunit
MMPEQFFANFEVFTDAPGGLRQLRELILQLAVQGKLVPQDPNDEPVSVPFARNMIEQRPSRTGGNSRREGTKSTKSAARESLEADQPAGWKWATVDGLYDVVGGIQKTPARRPVTNHFPYLRVANVQRGRLNLDRVERYELVEGELEKWRLQPDDLLIVEGNGSESEIGRCALWSGEIPNCVHQNHLIRCRPRYPEGNRFTLQFLNSPLGVSEMKRLAVTTSGLYSLSVGKVRSIRLPVPPFAEQARIVAKADRLMSLCDELESALKQAQAVGERLTAAAVHHLLRATEQMKRGIHVVAEEKN